MTKPEYAFLKKDGDIYESENENERERKGEGGGGGGEAATGMNNRNMYKSFLKKITSDGWVSPEQDCSYPTPTEYERHIGRVSPDGCGCGMAPARSGGFSGGASGGRTGGHFCAALIQVNIILIEYQLQIP